MEEELTPEEEKLFIKFHRRFLLSMPDVIGNLINQHMNNLKLKEKVFSKDALFKEHPKLVAAALLSTEGENPLLSQEEIVERAVPKIKELIQNTKSLKMKEVEKRPDLSTHGEI